MKRPFSFLNIVQDDEEIDVYINGEIIDNDAQGFYDFFGWDGTSPNRFKEALDSAGKKPLTIHINSVGGNLLAGMAMYSAIKSYKGETTCIIDGICASAATLPMVACGKVLMRTPATVMIHCASIWGSGGNRYDLEKDVEALKSLDKSIANAYEEKTKLGREKLLKMMEAETWMDAKKAKELGFIDEIAGDLDVPQSVMTNIINSNKQIVACLRGFEHPPATDPASADTSAEGGSKILDGKYANVEELERAYVALSAEFTRKCQELANLKAKAKEPATTDPMAETDPLAGSDSQSQSSAENQRAALALAIALAKAKKITGGK